MFAVNAADQHISSEEDHITRRIATELGIEHHEFIQVRSAYREHLSFLKK